MLFSSFCILENIISLNRSLIRNLKNLEVKKLLIKNENFWVSIIVSYKKECVVSEKLIRAEDSLVEDLLKQYRISYKNHIDIVKCRYSKNYFTPRS